MYVSNGLDSFEVFMRKNIFGFMQRVHAIDNVLVKCAISTSNIIYNGMVHKWFKYLYTCY